MEIAEVFRNEVSTPLLRELASGVQQIYVQTEQAADDLLHHTDERRNLRPWLRRSLMEQMLRGIVEVHPDVASMESHVDESGFWNHVHLKIGRFWITQHTLSGDEAALSPATYKKQAAALNQLYLFPDSELVDTTDTGTDLYAVLVHRRGENNSVGFAKIKFPKPNVEDGFISGEVDLMAEFPDVFGTSMADADEEVISEPASPEVLSQNNTGA